MSAMPLEASRPRKIRKRKLVDSSLQFKIIGAFLAVACVATLFQVILTNKAMLDVVRRSPVFGDQVLALVPSLLVRNMVLTLSVLIPVTLVVGILVTHRIAGPVFSMERYLLRIAEGKTPGAPCRLRDGDDLMHLCDAINVAITHLRGEDLGSPESDAGVSANLEDISSLVSQSDASPGEFVQGTAHPQTETD